MTDRQCYVCLETKDIDQFHKHPDGKDGHFNICKLCQHNQNKMYLRRKRGRVAQNNELLARWGR